MIGRYKLVGLSKPGSATIELSDGDLYNVQYHFDDSLWNYCENNWDNVNLDAIVIHGVNMTYAVVLQVVPRI